MTDFKEEGFRIDKLDLNNISPGLEDDHRVYNHDGSSTITLTDGSTTSKMGWYMWDNDNNSWFPMGQHADLVDGYHGADLAALAENETVTGQWKFDSNINLNENELTNISKLIGSNGQYILYSNDGRIAIWNNGIKSIDILENNDVSIPNGNLYSSGVRVEEGEHNPISIPATRWGYDITNSEIQRINVPSGKSLHVHSLEVALKGGGTASGLEVDIYEVDNSIVLASDTADGSMTTGLSSQSSSGATVLLRITNSTGTEQDASINANLVIK